MGGRIGLGRWTAACAVALTASLYASDGANAIALTEVGFYAAPVHIVSDPTDANRLYVVERNGVVKLVAKGQTTTFLDISALVPAPYYFDDRGLLSMALAPDYGSSGRFYVFYAGEGNALRVDEFTAEGDSASLATRRSVLEIEPHTIYHYGGQLQFGPDGYLYISTGDNAVASGSGGDPDNNGQNIESLHGKILRIDPRPAGGAPYAVPSDNPFVGLPGRDEIWSTGLRNPWRFSFDRDTGDLVVSDVGQHTWEEINYAPRSAGGGRGDNYGWKCREGPDPYSGCTGTFTDPAFAYPHAPTDCTGSVTGGYVVRDPGLPSLLGRYLYGDFCTGAIRSLRLALPTAFDDRPEGNVPTLSSFGEDACGRIYIIDLAGPIYRLVEGAPTDCEDPVLALRGRRTQRLGGHGRISTRVWVDERATVKLTATVTAFGHGQASARLKRRTRLVPAGTLRRMSWSLGDLRLERYRRLLLEGRRVRVRFRATAVDARGNASSAAKRTRLVLSGGMKDRLRSTRRGREAAGSG